MAIAILSATYSGAGAAGTGSWVYDTGFGQSAVLFGGFAGDNLRSVFQYDIASLGVGATINSVSASYYQVANFGIGYVQFSLWPFNSNGQGNPQGTYSTAFAQAANTNTYVAGHIRYRGTVSQTVSFALPSSAATHLQNALTAGSSFTLCQGLDFGQEVGNDYVAVGSNVNTTAARRPTLRVDYTPGGGGTNVTVSAGVLSGSLSTPASTVSAQRNISAAVGILSASLSLPAPSIIAQSNISVSVGMLSAAFSIGSASVQGDSSISLGLLSGTFNISSPDLSIGSTALVSVLSGSTSILSAAVESGGSVSVSVGVLSGSFSTLVPSILTQSNISISVGVLSATGDIISPSVSTSVSVSVEAPLLSGSLSLPAADVVIGAISVDAIVGSLSLLAPTILTEYSVSVQVGILSGSLSLPTPSIDAEIVVPPDVPDFEDVTEFPSSLDAEIIGSVRNILPPPIKQPLINPTTKLVDVVWSNYFNSITQMFNNQSYGYKEIDLSATGIRGEFSVSAVCLTDRQFVTLNVSIIPTSAGIETSGAYIYGISIPPITDQPLTISRVSNNLSVDSQSVIVTTENQIHIPNYSNSTYRILISGQYLRKF